MSIHDNLNMMEKWKIAFVIFNFFAYPILCHQKQKSHYKKCISKTARKIHFYSTILNYSLDMFLVSLHGIYYHNITRSHPL